MASDRNRMKTYALDARTATNHFPGIGRYVSNLATSMAEQLRSDEQLLLLRRPGQKSHWRLPAASRQFEQKDVKASPFGLSQQWSIPNRLGSRPTLLYHSPYYLMPYWLSVPTVLTLYDLIPLHLPQTVSLRARLLFRLATRFALRASAHVITISQSARQDLLAAFDLDASRVTAIPLASDPHFAPRPEAERSRVRDRYQLPDPYVLYLGINKPHKNLDTLLMAWRWLLDFTAVKPPQLIIAGAWDPRYPDAKLNAASLGLGEYVRFLGPVTEEDLPALYSAAKLFVFPSRYEGFGLPVIEAMACGTAVACSDSSSLPEVAGDAALYFDPDNRESIGRAVGQLLLDDSLRANLGYSGLAQAATFSWRRTAAETLSIYRSVAARPAE